MPVITMDLDGLEHNILVMRRLLEQWGCSMLPVLKMVACHPAVSAAVYRAGFPAIGAADVDEPDLFGAQPEGGRVLINIAPPGRARDVVRRFQRSAISSLPGFLALESAASDQHLRHDALLMLDGGDLREGVPLSEAAAVARAIRNAKPKHARLMGVGINMGCLYGACPDDDNMAALAQAVAEVEAVLERPVEVISLGGSIFLERLARHAPSRDFGPGGRVEFRAGDPLLLGYDLYRRQSFSAGDFRRDLFTLQADVVETCFKDIKVPAHSVYNGQGHMTRPGQTGRRRRALLDCGRLHTEVEELSLDLPGAQVVGFSGNYTIVDVTDCPHPPSEGDSLTFRPGYWAVAKAFRSPLVRKRFIHGDSTGVTV